MLRSRYKDQSIDSVCLSFCLEYLDDHFPEDEVEMMMDNVDGMVVVVVMVKK